MQSMMRFVGSSAFGVLLVIGGCGQVVEFREVTPHASDDAPRDAAASDASDAAVTDASDAGSDADAG